jgi:hemerythrin-like domain-containing protein
MTTATYQTDVSDMLIPHNMLRSVLGSAEAIVEGVQREDRDHRAAVTSYFDNVLRFLDAHHGGEDACIWPLLGERCPTAAELLDRMGDEHEAIHASRERAGAALVQWSASGDAASELVSTLNDLRSRVEQHFREEETEILPLASANMSPEEWAALPGHAMAHFAGDKIWLILGLVLEQMTDEQRAFTLSLLPPPAVEMWTTMGNAAFDEFIAEVRSTA